MKFTVEVEYENNGAQFEAEADSAPAAEAGLRLQHPDAVRIEVVEP